VSLLKGVLGNKNVRNHFKCNCNKKHVLTTSVNEDFLVHKRLSGDAAVPRRVFRDNFVTFRRRPKRIAFLESVNFYTCACMQTFNFRDSHVTTFRHPSGASICQMPGHRLSRLAKGTPSEAQLSIGTIGLG